jgi:hypothetical protein
MARALPVEGSDTRYPVAAQGDDRNPICRHDFDRALSLELALADKRYPERLG